MNVAGGTGGVDDARNQAFGFIDIQARGAACQAIGLEAVEDARDAGAVDADGAKLVGARKDLVRLSL